MAVTKTIEVDGKEVQFRASAAIPRLYRNKFHRDIYKDLNELQKGIDENDTESSNLDTFSLELFENIAWLMAKHQFCQLLFTVFSNAHFIRLSTLSSILLFHFTQFPFG